jgi:D-alanyl-D-alanine carboxypeptidase/D-alanyl-D-alanine-endopeptidase (penicillin-binding protein 4)
MPSTPQPGAHRRRSVTIAAVGLALGLGAVVTLALIGVGAPPGTDVSQAAQTPDLTPSSAAPPTTTTTTTTTTRPPPCDRRAALDGAEPAPPAASGRIAAALADPRWVGLDRSVSVWIEGRGEVVGVGGDAALLPASNEKLLTAIGAHLLLDPHERFHTEVRDAGDHLVLVAGGDPSLRSTGPHSLGELARQVAAAGRGATAGVVVDATAFEPATAARGWQDWQIPTYVGPMSALVVDDNRGRTDPAFLSDPAIGNGEAFARALIASGVAVGGPVAHGTAPTGAPVVAELWSPTVAELTADMLQRSDNEIAESLVRLIGEGSTEVGVDRIGAALEPWCLHLAGDIADGSGLSREDKRSARDLRRLLQVAAAQPWGPALHDALPVAGVSGTLAGRLAGPATAGNVRAKTGTIIGGTALSGYATAADGRAVVFSVVVNAEPSAALGAAAAVDRLVAAVVSTS